MTLWFLFPLLAGCTQKRPPEPIRIGQVGSLTGTGQAAGVQAEQGADLAAEEVNRAEGQLIGRPVEIHHVDTRGDRDTLRPAVVRLITVTRVAALLLGTEAAAEDDLGSTAQEDKVPMLLPAGVPGRPGSDYLFYTGLTPALQGPALARFAAKELKGASVLVLSSGSARASALADAFTRELRKHGGKPGPEPMLYKSAAEFKEIVPRLKAAPPGAILLAGSASDLVELCQAGLDEKVPVIFGGEEGSLKDLLAVRGTNVVYLATVFTIEGGGKRAQEFARRYQEKFGEPPDVHAALAYDGARILFEGVRRANAVDGASVQKALAGLKDFDSLTGPLSFGPDHAAQRPVFILRLTGGKPETLPSPEPGQAGPAGTASSAHAAP